MNDVVVAYPYDRRGRELYRVDHCFKDAEGIPRRLKKRGFESRGAAISWAEKEITLIRTGVKKMVPSRKRGPRVSHTVESGLLAILRWREENGRVKPSTRYISECVLRKHVFSIIGRKPWEELTQADVDRLVEAGRPMRNPKHLVVLKSCLKVAEQAGLPALGLKIESPKIVVNMRTDFINHEELEMICRHAEPLWAAAFRVLFHTGVRVGELLALEWDDLDLRTGAEYIRVCRKVYHTREVHVGTPKGGEMRVLPLNDAAVAAFREIASLRFPDEELAPVPGAPLARRLVIADDLSNHYVRRTTVYAKLKQACRKAGLREISPHLLRHSHASLMVQAGVYQAVVKQLLGHKSIKATDRYIHLMPEGLRCGVKALTNR